ncbi:putative oxidoreductase [Beauveria bassiana]|uniref:Putative oxidoreductase n=1 Tax=Beauveria bassiana TaxID=176275 RepID=A0A2N6NJR1_BEABA|nr:putative oxidoreductase [Beauveria bassiana]
MEVFGLKSQSLRYKMDGFGSVQMYLTPPDYFDLAAPPPASHGLTQAAAATTAAAAAAAATATTAMSTSAAQPKTTLIVGASRGIGRELVQQLAQQQPRGQVIASVRSAVDFGGSPNIRSITLDQSSAKSISEAAFGVAALDTLVVNAAVGDDERLLDTSDERMAEYMDVNVTGVLRIVKAFLPALKARKTRQIVLVSSASGSLTRQVNARAGFKGPYAVSKAALNMVAVQLHNELHESDGFTVVPIHPGWVSTDMGRIGGDGGMPVSKSVAGIVKILDKLTPQNSATFYNYDGTTLPW